MSGPDHKTPTSFIAAVWQHWQALVTGGAVAVFGLLWAQFGPPGTIPSWVFWLVVIACLFIAGWLAWRDVYQELLTERRRHTPLLQASIVQSITGTGPNNSTALFLFIEIRNIGEMPSIADKWRVRVSPPFGPDMVGSIEHLQGPVTLNGADGKVFQLSMTDAIYQKTSLTPIVTGAKQTGVLYASLNMPQQSADAAGTKFTVECEDVLGHLVTASVVRRAVPSHPQHIPGIGFSPKLGNKK